MTLFFYWVFGAMCVACVLSVVVHFRVLRHFRIHHPQLWLTFGFHGSGTWVQAQHEASHLAAERKFKQFLRSPSRLQLQDSKLDTLLSVARAINLAGLLLFILTLLLWLYFDVWKGVL